MLRHRLITGPLLIAFIVGAVWLDEWLTTQHLAGVWLGAAEMLGWRHPTVPPGCVLFVLALSVVPLMAIETAGMLREAGVVTSQPLSIASSCLAFVAVTLLRSFQSPVEVSAAGCTLLVAIFLGGVVWFSRGQNVKGVMAATGGLLFVTTYAGVLMAFWMLIRAEHGAWLVLGAILTTKSCDIGAYFTGVSIGRHKLVPWLSPGKTWEGLAGGIVTAALVGATLAACSASLANPADRLPWWFGAVGGAVVAVVGQLGDLVESLFKRDAGRKDSGRLLPGMGGILDVLDSPLLTGPAVFWLLALAPLS